MNERAHDTQAALVSVRGLAKRYGSFVALDGVDLDIPAGRIVGVIGANGAGKTTMLSAMLGLIPYEGEVRVMGRDPLRERAHLMHEVCFIADVATLPRYLRVDQLLDYVEGVHPKFSRARALDFLARTRIPPKKRIGALSKGMVTQLHLAIVMAIDAKLLVLDEPTLGLDIVFRKEFHRSLLEDYFDEGRTILITTHQVEEVEHILSDVIFVHGGRIVLEDEIEALPDRFAELVVDAKQADEVRPFGPIHERSALGRTSFVFERPDRAVLSKFGKLHGMKLADIFVAKISGEAS